MTQPGITVETASDGTVTEFGSDGHPIQMTLTDGSVFTAFDSNGRPTAGVLPAHSGEPATDVRIVYQPDGGSTWSYGDGTTLVRSPSGGVLAETLPDGSVYTAFDSDGRPTAGTVPGQSGGAAQHVSISYDGAGGDTWKFGDGTVVQHDASGHVVAEIAGGITYTKFDLDQRPVAATVPGQNGGAPQQATITYDANGGDTWNYDDGTVVQHDASGNVVRENTGGVTYTSFDQQGRPIAATVPGQGGAPAQQAAITYTAAGDTWTLQDNTKLVHDSSGALTTEQLPDGTTFTAFDRQGRPTAGVVPPNGGQPSQAVAISYQSDGTGVWTYQDQSKTVISPTGQVIQRVTADGWTYTAFTSDGKPTAGNNGSQQVTISYAPDGSSVWTYGDHTVVSRAPNGQVVSMVDPTGWTFTSFDSAGRPVQGNSGDQSVTIAYQGDGDQVWTYGDGEVVTRNGNSIIREVTPDGWTFTSFDPSGRPLAGTNGNQAVTITYGGAGDGSTSVWTYGDGTVVNRNGSGAVVSMTTPDGWTFTSFDPSGRPLAGTNGQQAVTITYQANGNAVWNLGPGQSTLTYDSNGTLVSMVTPDGWTFTSFDDQGRPTAGSNGTLSATITYNPDGTEKWQYSDGSTLIMDANGKPIEEIVPDGKGGFVDIVFSIELPLMLDTIQRTQANQQTISDALGRLQTKMNDIIANWTGPAATAYAAKVAGVTKVTNDFNQIFTEAVTRMQGVYDNYTNTENQNTQNLQSGHSSMRIEDSITKPPPSNLG